MGQKNGLVYQWAKKGTRARQPKDQRYASCYIFGAFCAARDVGAALVMPYADTKSMHKHLDEISKNVAPQPHGRHLDGRWHKSADRSIPKNMSFILIIPPPAQGRGRPYSPELNPVENIWQISSSKTMTKSSIATPMPGTVSVKKQAALHQSPQKMVN